MKRDVSNYNCSMFIHVVTCSLSQRMTGGAGCNLVLDTVVTGKHVPDLWLGRLAGLIDNNSSVEDLRIQSWAALDKVVTTTSTDAIMSSRNCLSFSVKFSLSYLS